MRKKKRVLKKREKFIISISVGILITLILLIILSIIASLIDLPVYGADTVGLISACVCGYCSSYIFGILSKKNGIRCGTIVAAVFCGLIFVCGIIGGSVNLIKLVLIFFSSVSGGVIGVNSKFIKY